MTYVVELTEVAPLPIAVVQRRSTIANLSQVIPPACGEVWNFIRANSIPHTGLNLVVYRGTQGCSQLDLECGVIVSASFSGTETIASTTTPHGRAATTVHMGPYHRLGDANQAIRDWCDARHLALTGVSWEIYGHWNDDPAQLRTDVFWLVADDTA
ncbi:MAG: GyrI-like domain-containing protein [Pirellulales bacterium]